MKRYIYTIFALLISLSTLAQSQYDYMDDGGSGGVDNALNAIVIVVVLVIGFFVLAIVTNISFNVYYFFNPEKNPEVQKKKSQIEKENAEILRQYNEMEAQRKRSIELARERRKKWILLKVIGYPLKCLDSRNKYVFVYITQILNWTRRNDEPEYKDVSQLIKSRLNEAATINVMPLQKNEEDDDEEEFSNCLLDARLGDGVNIDTRNITGNTVRGYWAFGVDEEIQFDKLELVRGITNIGLRFYSDTHAYYDGKPINITPLSTQVASAMSKEDVSDEEWGDLIRFFAEQTQRKLNQNNKKL